MVSLPPRPRYLNYLQFSEKGFFNSEQKSLKHISQNFEYLAAIFLTKDFGMFQRNVGNKSKNSRISKYLFSSNI